MPNILKNFNRRKSLGYALDEVRNPPAAGESSFRVLERPASKGKAFDGGVHLRMASTTGPAPALKDQYEENDVFSVSSPAPTNR